ncbi:MAG: hypothetical protein EP330_18160 [Deltaproteobacteria bacterium]|nr:MAG: hypothetical protein EP330_18160 [Deltaproteobacteria bacterium]
MSEASDPFAAPMDDGGRRRPLWPLVRFVVRRILLLGVIPISVAVVGGSVGGATALFVAWAIPLILWLPSTLLTVMVMLSGKPADERAVELSDGRVMSRRNLGILLGTRAWESVTIALMLPVMGLGFAPYSTAFATTLVLVLGMIPLMLLRVQWVSLSAGRAALALASEDNAKAEKLLRGIVDARLTAPSFKVATRLMLARAVARQGRVDEALALLDGQEHELCRVLRAQLLLGRGELELARELVHSRELKPLPIALGDHVLAALLALYEDAPERVVELAAIWRPDMDERSLQTSRFLDLLHAIALYQLGREQEAWIQLRRRGANLQDYPGLAAAHPTLEALRHQLLERGGEHG